MSSAPAPATRSGGHRSLSPLAYSRPVNRTKRLAKPGFQETLRGQLIASFGDPTVLAVLVVGICELILFSLKELIGYSSVLLDVLLTLAAAIALLRVVVIVVAETLVDVRRIWVKRDE